MRGRHPRIYPGCRFRSYWTRNEESLTPGCRKSVPDCYRRGTVLLSSRAPIGYLAVAEIPVAINQGFIAMVAKAGTSNLFLLLWASVAHEDIVSRANGSTFLEISKANFRPIPVVTPSARVMQLFERLARPLYERLVECERESRAIAELRDALLPKLVSGEVRVKDAEKIIEVTA